MSISLHRGPAGEPGGGSFAGTFERKEAVFLASFLDAEVIKILSLEAMAPMIRVGEETSAHILCECEALASLRHA